jgi:cysteinyl-tRNA synthetase
MHESSGNAIRVRALVEQHGPELIRYLVLSTHYRRPIDFSDEVLESSKKGMSVFYRLFERVARLSGKSLDDATPDMEAISATIFETPHASFARDVLGLKMKFLEMMDDDFNTAGAIAVLHELAGATNAFIERNDIERTRAGDLTGYATAAAQTLRKLALILGLFRNPAPLPSAAASDDTLDKVMGLLIELRAQARASKNFALADSIRNGLTKIGITLEDRADGTLWRKQ